MGEKLLDAVAEVLKPTGLPFVFAGHVRILISRLAENTPKDNENGYKWTPKYMTALLTRWQFDCKVRPGFA